MIAACEEEKSNFIRLSKFLDIVIERLRKINYTPIRDDRFGEGIRLKGISYYHHNGLDESYQTKMGSNAMLMTINELTALLSKVFDAEGYIKISVDDYIKGYMIMTIDIYHNGKVLIPSVN
jgi:hypothetical protein